MKIVVVGGVAAGPKAAARVRRLLPEAEITLVEQDEALSYAGCGLPYHLGGMVPSLQALMETARHAWAYLFFTGRAPGERAFEDRQTQVRDWYN